MWTVGGLYSQQLNNFQMESLIMDHNKEVWGKTCKQNSLPDPQGTPAGLTSVAEMEVNQCEHIHSTSRP